jgi:hypothetical protein
LKSCNAQAHWQGNFISAYSTAHPWEDWAESWAYFMHIQDNLEAASDFGLVGKSIRLGPNEGSRKTLLSSEQPRFEGIISA